MSERPPAPRSRSRRRVLRSASRGGEVTVALDGELLPEERLPSTPEALEQTALAADIVEEARHRSDELLRQASLQVSDVERVGHAAGFERGYAEGLAAARIEIARALELIQAVARQGHALRDELIRTAEGEIVEIALAAFEQVVSLRAAEDPALIVETVQRALDRLGAQTVVHIAVHPDQAEILRAWLSERGGAAAEWELREDGSVVLGGCMIDTTAGQVDARLDIQLAQISGALRGAVPRAG